MIARRIAYPVGASTVLRALARGLAALFWGMPAYITITLAYRACAMCSARCDTVLRAENHGRVGPSVPLCSSCFEDDSRLLHAMRFAVARWRR